MWVNCNQDEPQTCKDKGTQWIVSHGTVHKLHPTWKEYIERVGEVMINVLWWNCARKKHFFLLSWYWMQCILIYGLYMGQRHRIDDLLLRHSLILSSIRGDIPYPWWNVLNMISLWLWCLFGLIDSNNIISYMYCLYISYFNIQSNKMMTGWYRHKLTRREYIV